MCEPGRSRNITYLRTKRATLNLDHMLRQQLPHAFHRQSINLRPVHGNSTIPPTEHTVQYSFFHGFRTGIEVRVDTFVLHDLRRIRFNWTSCCTTTQQMLHLLWPSLRRGKRNEDISAKCLPNTIATDLREANS